MKKSPKAGSSRTPIIQTTAKPFCNCKNCVDMKCPNLLDKLSILREKSAPKKGKMKSKTHECDSVIQAKLEQNIPCSLADKSLCAQRIPKKLPKPKIPRLLDELKLPEHFTGCGCGGIAHALGKHLHMNLGMAHKREIINGWRRGSMRRESSTATLYKQDSTIDSYQKNSV